MKHTEFLALTASLFDKNASSEAGPNLFHAIQQSAEPTPSFKRTMGPSAKKQMPNMAKPHLNINKQPFDKRKGRAPQRFLPHNPIPETPDPLIVFSTRKLEHRNKALHLTDGAPAFHVTFSHSGGGGASSEKRRVGITSKTAVGSTRSGETRYKKKISPGNDGGERLGGERPGGGGASSEKPRVEITPKTAVESTKDRDQTGQVGMETPHLVATIKENGERGNEKNNWPGNDAAHLGETAPGLPKPTLTRAVVPSMETGAATRRCGAHISANEGTARLPSSPQVTAKDFAVSISPPDEKRRKMKQESDQCPAGKTPENVFEKSLSAEAQEDHDVATGTSVIGPNQAPPKKVPCFVSGFLCRRKRKRWVFNV